MTLVVLAYLFYFIASSASPLQIRWLKANRPPGGEIMLAFWVMLMMALLGGLLPLFSPFYIAGSPLAIILLAVACGVFGAGYFVGSYVAQKHVEAGLSSLALNLSTPVAILLATFFLNEKLTPLQIAGTILLFVALYLISNKNRTGAFKFDKYFLLMLASGVMTGILLTAERRLQIMTGFSAGTMISWWAQCLALGVAALIWNRKNNYSVKDTLTTGIFRYFQALSYVMLVTLVGNLSVVSAITTFKVVIIFAAAAMFLKERDDLPRKIFGCVIAVVGLLLMK